LRQLLVDQARSFASRADRQISLRVAVPVTGAGHAPAAAGQANGAAARFDAVVSAGSATATAAELSAAAAEMVSGVSALVEHASCGVVSGTVTVVIAGEGPVFTLYPLRRIWPMSAEAFHEYWLHRHGGLARAVPGLSGYRQFHGDPHVTAELARALGFGVSDFDGCAEGRRATIQATAVTRGPELDAVLADEQNFIDLARCGPTMYRAIFGAEAFGG